ncbi:hypothetical protein KZP23_20925 [Echinicola marina]|uniref:DUF6600 domain-containing protein n=1 Tax=Echinicola marina TaxID=2859768 RepID=UPI001CF623F0|nr:DUF6600 domain-containing protein [Echinicola marina]UCS93095.1 hypothetical protein KZP23_20925 [Echinicola marina]
MNKQKLNKWLGISLLMWLTIAIVTPKQAKAEAPIGVSFQVFYDQLSPHGDWVEDARYGYIWLPYVDHNFHPYGTNGHWVMTEYGNTWVSDYSWGWAPFHYGRWLYDDYYGWAWVPGYEWAPAWVSWRNGGGYYGWAPLGPNVSISVNIGIPSFHWVFVPHRRFTHRHVYRYYAPRRNIVNIYNQTTVINNTVIYNNHRYIAGPGKQHIERYSRSRVPVYRVNSSQKPGRTNISRNAVNVYKPQIRSNSGNSRYNAKPSKITSRQNARVNREEYSRGNTAIRGNRSNTNSRSYGNSNTNRSSSPSATYRGSSPSRSEQSNSNKPKTMKATPYPNGSNNRQVRSPRNTTYESNKGNAYSGRTKASPSTRTKSSSPSRVSRPSSSNRQVKSQPSRSRTAVSKSPQVRRAPATRSSSRSSNSSASSRRSSSSRGRSNN